MRQPYVTSLGTSLFSGFGGNAEAFGRGLAQVTNDKAALWRRLSETFIATPGSRNFGILVGILGELNAEHPEQAGALLDSLLLNTELKAIFVRLQCSIGIDGTGLGRLHRLLDQDEPFLWQFESVGWGNEWEAVSEEDVSELLEHLASRQGGAHVAVSALGMRVHWAKQKSLEFGAQLRLAALEIIRKALLEDGDRRGGMFDHHLAELLTEVFLPEEAPEACASVVSTFVETILSPEGKSSELDDCAIIIARRMPGQYLTEIMYSDSPYIYNLRRLFRSRYNKPPFQEVEPGDLVEWCREADSEKRFLFVAEEIFPFSSFGDGEDDAKPLLTNQAISLLANAPDKGKILAILAKACLPNSWSGRRSDIIEERRRALALALEERPELVYPVQVAEVLAGLDSAIETERASERREDQENEQTFE